MGVGDWTGKGCKINGSHTAVGYWGRDIHQRIFAEQEHARQRALLQDQILAGSMKAALWIGTEDGNKCSCYKESNQQADRKCGACHGVGIVPGYYKFGYNTLFMSGMDSDIVLSGVKLTTNFKSSKIQLEDGEVSGTLESADKLFQRTVAGSTWEYQVLSFLREESESNVIVEYSLDSGDTWNAIATLVTSNPAGSKIRFRTTLTRTSASVISPLFEIVRARYATIGFSYQQADATYRMGPWILVMRNPPTTRHRKYEYGDIPVEDGLTFWTAGLAMFDPAIEMGSVDELIKGPDAVIEILEGAREGSRYLAVSWQNSDPFGVILVSQTFQVRIVDPVGPLSLLW